MKNRLLFLLMLLISVVSIAQNGFNYKALLKDTNGNPMVNTTLTIEFYIIDSMTATDVYSETHSTTTDANAIVNVVIGQGTTGGDFNSIDWSAGPYELSVAIDDGNEYIDLGSSPFTAVPYAKVAEVATTLAPQPHKIINWNYPDGFEDIEPVTFRRTTDGYDVPPGKNLYITHIFAIEGANLTITSLGLTLISGNESYQGLQSLTQPLIVGAGENIAVGATTTEVYGFLIDAKVTPVYGSDVDYTVPTNKILMITNTRGNIWYLIQNGLRTVYRGVGNSQLAAGNSSFFQPIPLNEGQVIRGTTWSGYLIDK